MTVAKVWNGTAWEAVAGGVSQAQFDAMSGRISALEAQYKPIIYTAGPITGNNGNLATTWTALPSFALSFTTPAYATRCTVQWRCRVSYVVVAWVYSVCGLGVTGAGVTARLLGNAVAGAVGVNTTAEASIIYGGNNGPVNVTHACFDVMTLTASTAYTFQVFGIGSAAASASWTNMPTNTIMASLVPA